MNWKKTVLAPLLFALLIIWSISMIILSFSGKENASTVYLGYAGIAGLIVVPLFVTLRKYSKIRRK